MEQLGTMATLKLHVDLDFFVAAEWMAGGPNIEGKQKKGMQKM